MNGVSKLAVFASGTGTNLENIIHAFSSSNKLEINLVYTNKECRSASIGQENNIPTVIGNNDLSNNGDALLQMLKEHEIDGIILAGYLRLIPKKLIEAYTERMLNIHPSLLPKYGGKGMYGMNVHKAVKENNEATTGITIHVVTPEFDKGRVVFQAETTLEETDSAEDIAEKVQVLEQKYFPKVIEHYFMNL